MTVQIQRSWLFVPGNQSKLLDKAAGLPADVLVYDLEDSVPLAEKCKARSQVAMTLSQKASRRQLRFVRVSGTEPESLVQDLKAVLGAGLDGIVVPKVDYPEQIQRADELLAELERESGLPAGGVRVAATIESAKGVVSAPEFAESSKSLVALLFGAVDFRLSLATFDFATNSGGVMDYARSVIAIAAASCGLLPIDRVVVDCRDLELLVEDTRQAIQLGYRAKAVIHPAQIEPVNELFSPNADDTAKARRIIDAYEAGLTGGRGSVAVDGAMVDFPVVEKARRIVEFSEALRTQNTQIPKYPSTQ